LADYDPVKIEQYFKMPLWEMWAILDNKLGMLEKSKKKK
jgi:hypothetical protein